MILLIRLVFSVSVVLLMAQNVFAEVPAETEIQLSPPMNVPHPEGQEPDDYEMAVFNPPKDVQDPGTHLMAPGDTYRYTFYTNPEYVNHPTKELKSAFAGVHFIDHDYDAEKGDQFPEWARVTFNGKPMMWYVPDMLKPMGYREGQEPYSSEFFEVESEEEAHPSGRMPAYLFDLMPIADEIKAGKLVVEITNLRSDGTDHTVESDAPFGDFIMLRVGNHFYWGDIEE